MIGSFDTKFQGRGGGVYLFLSDEVAPFSKVSLTPYFYLERGISRRQFFWSWLSKHVKIENFFIGLFFSLILVFWSILFADFF